MAIRKLLSDPTKNAQLEASLLRGDSFAYAHLVKFEKPLKTKQGDSRGQGVDYVYITDGSQDLVFDDGSTYEDGNTIQSNGNQTYVANKLLKVGNVSESITAKAANINITISGAALGIAFQSSLTITNSNTITATVDFVEQGFREGDDIQLLSGSGANDTVRARIDRFSNNNLTAHVTPSYKDQTDSQGDVTPLFVTSGLTAESGVAYSVNFDTAVVESVLSNRAAGTYARYINRDIFIYKAHIDTNGVVIGDPFLIFKGIIGTAKLTETPENGTIISWGVTSHWGDFVRVNGRLTSDAHHRALDGEGQTDPDALKRADYENDLGFLHSEQAINLIANYDVAVTKTRLKKKSSWFGLKTKYSQQEYTVMEERETDLRFNLDAKYLPVVYGVGKIKGIPIFVDTLNTDNSVVFTAYALSEGEIGGIYDIHFDGTPSICIDENDFDTRSSRGSDGAVDVICYGRADRGDTLDSKTVLTGSSFVGGAHTGAKGSVNWGASGGYAGIGPGQIAYRDYTSTGYNETSPTAASASTQGAGITHKKGTFFDVPIDTQLQFLSGKSNQEASSLLTQNKSNFKVGNSYYSGSAEYWGDQHTLLDTAYAVCKFTISEGEITIPTPEFVVRGKAVDCYNYDYSYELHSSHTSSALTSFNLGDTVNLKRTSDNAALDSTTAVIADIYYITALSGTQEARVRLRDTPALTITSGSTVTKVTSFYIQDQSSSSTRIYLRTYDDIEDSGSIGEKLETTITSGSANSGNDGANITIHGATTTAFKAGLDFTDAGVAIHENGGAAGQSFGRDLVSDYRLFGHATNSNTITNIGATGENASSLANSKLTLKNVVKLDKDPVGGGPGKWLKLKKKWPDNSTPAGAKKKRKGYGLFKIAAKDSTNKLLSVIQTIDAAVVPDANDSYEVSSSIAEDGPEDPRVTLNPAMHLLDYLTNDIYGRELDIDKDIDLESFLEAARDCDTRSDVTMVTTAAATVGAVYKFVSSLAGSKVFWVGTVQSSTQIGSSSRYNIVFTKVSGKFVYRWENWKYFYTGEYYYYRGALHQATSNGVISSTPSTTSTISTTNITKVSGSGPGNLTIEVGKAQATFDGNPVIKKGLDTTERPSESGYSLYDADDVKYWRFVGWDAQNQRHVTRHQLNTVIDTSRPVFQNVNDLLNQFNGILRYAAGKYSLAIKKGYEDPTTRTVDGITYTIDDISEDDIIGQINIEDGGQKGSFNSVNVSIEDPQNKFEGRQVSLFNSTYLKQDKGIKKDGQVSTPDITNYYNARINAKQYLDQSRAGLKVNFTMTPKGLLHSAGDIIRITYPRFNWTNKLYRITNLTFNENCLVQVTAEEHEDNAYLIIPERAPIKGADGLGANDAPPAPPTSLSATNNKRGGIQLDWVNTTTFNATTYNVEIYRATSNDRTHSSLKKIGVSKSDTFTDPIIEEGLTERYYWIRYAVNRPQKRIAGIAPREVFSTYNPSSATGAAVGSAAGAVDGISISMSNDNATCVADEAGTVSSFANTGTVIKVFITGGSPIAYDNVSPYQNNSFRIASASASGVTAGAATEGTNIYSQANITAMPGDTGAITYSIIVKDAIGTERTFEKIQTFTKSKRGEFGKTAELIGSKYVINYSTAGAESDSLTFTGTARNFGATTPYFEFFVDGVSKQSSAVGSGSPPTKSFTLADSDEPGIGGTKTIKLQIRENGTSGAIVAEDSVSIYGVQDGSDAVTGFLTNEAHTVGANFEGSSNVGAAGGDFRVFVGGTNVTTSCTFSVVSESGVDMSIGSSSGTYTVTSFPDANTGGTALFRAVVPAATAGTQNNVTVEKTYTISKAKSSSPVIKGELTNNSHSFTADVSGNISSSDLTAGGGTFTVTKDGVDVSSNSNVTFSRVSQSGITTAINNNGVYTISAFPSGTSTGTATFRATIASGFTGTGSAQTIDLVYTASKGKTGADGISGTAIRELTLFYQFSVYGGSQPSTPTSGTYNFSSGIVASIASGWSQTRPSTEIGKIVYQSTALATESSAGSGVSGTISWSSPGIGDKGIGDVNFIFQYSTNQPTTPSAINVFTNNGIPTGWSDSPPTNPNDGRKLWSSKGKAELTGSIHSGFAFNYTWETPVVHVQAKSDVGLGSAEDKSSQDIRDEIVEADIVGGGKVFTGGKPNKIELDNFLAEEGRFRFREDGGSFVTIDPFSGTARTQVNNVRQGIDPVTGTGSVRNTNVQMNTDGSISVNGGGSGNPTMNTLTDGGNVRSRILAGLNTSGDVDRAVPVAKGGTSQTNVDRFLNSEISIATSGTQISIGRGGYSTVSISGLGQGLVGLSGVSNNADQTSSNTANNTSNVGNQTVANAQSAVVRANAGLTTTGDVNRAVPTAKGGTGETNTGRFLNSSIGISTSTNSISISRGGGYSTVSISGLSQSLVNLSGVSNNADQTSSNTSADTSAVGGTAAATVRNGAASGATANQDSTSTILGGNHTGSVGGVAASTVTGGAARANAGLDSSGNVARAVPSSRLTAINTASVNQPVFIWTELSNAGFSPTATSFTFIIEWKDGTGADVAESRWTATRDTGNDDINPGGITDNYSGSGVTSVQSGANTTSSTVTFTRGNTSVKVTASIVSFTGFTFKS